MYYVYKVGNPYLSAQALERAFRIGKNSGTFDSLKVGDCVIFFAQNNQSFLCPQFDARQIWKILDSGAGIIANKQLYRPEFAREFHDYAEQSNSFIITQSVFNSLPCVDKLKNILANQEVKHVYATSISNKETYLIDSLFDILAVLDNLNFSISSVFVTGKQEGGEFNNINIKGIGANGIQYFIEASLITAPVKPLFSVTVVCRDKTYLLDLEKGTLAWRKTGTVLPIESIQCQSISFVRRFAGQIVSDLTDSAPLGRRRLKHFDGRRLQGAILQSFKTNDIAYCEKI